MQRPKVVILKTGPETVLADIHRAMVLGRVRDFLKPDADTALKINISWHYFFPAASTTPWQLDGVIRGLKREGFRPERLWACHNRTVVTDARLGERENKHLGVVLGHGLRNVHLYEASDWVNVRDAAGDVAEDFLVLNRVYPEGFRIPARMIGANVVHLPTVKTHVFTVITGAMKNAFGGLLNERRHWTHPVIHETLVDLLALQRRIHPGQFTVMDGTFAGDGPGPRCMTPHVKNVLIAAADPVAADAASATLMGFDPLSIPFLRLAHERGLGVAEMSGIDVLGDADLLDRPWGFVGPFRRMTFASRMQHRIYWGNLRKPLEWSLRTFLAPWAYIASVVYHDLFWYPLHLGTVRKVLSSPWGRLFHNWEPLALPPDDLATPGWPDPGPAPRKWKRGLLRLLWTGMRVLVLAIRKAPEFRGKKSPPRA